MKITQTMDVARTVAAPRAEVWEVFCRVEDWAGWNPLMHTSGMERGQGLEPGNRLAFGIRLRPLGLPVTVRAEVVAVEPERRVVWTGSLLGVHSVHAFEFSDVTQGCLVTSREQLGGWALLPARLLYSPARITELTARWLAALAREAEARSISE